jgi:hypothetical protein
MNHATAGCMGDSVCTPHRIEFVGQSMDVKLGCVDGNAKVASNRFV